MQVTQVTQSNNTSRSKTTTPSCKELQLMLNSINTVLIPPALCLVHIVSNSPLTDVDSDSL